MNDFFKCEKCNSDLVAGKGMEYFLECPKCEKKKLNMDRECPQCGNIYDGAADTLCQSCNNKGC